MGFIQLSKDGQVAILTIKRGKVNALNEELIDELHGKLKQIEKIEKFRALILTAQGKFFTFGFDIPEFIKGTKDEFKRYLHKFTALYAYIFQYPKPVIAAINGHAIAGGCMLVNACDYRLMVIGKAKISLNELSFGASVFAGCVDMLKYWVGPKKAQEVLFSASMYSAEQAHELGLIDRVVGWDDLDTAAMNVAKEYAAKDPLAFASIKKLLRKPIVDALAGREADSVDEFHDIWYSENTWLNLQEIIIRE